MRNAVRWIAAAAVGVVVMAGCASSGAGSRPGLLTLTSPAFEEGGVIPLRHSAYGEELSPVLNWAGVPEGTLSFALILEDLDDGSRPYVHWVVYNIPADATGLPEGLSGPGVLGLPPELAGTTTGFNSRRGTDYYGPEPPRGAEAHRYRFQLYALSLEPDVEDSLNAAALRQVIEGSVLDQAELTGRFRAPAE